MVYLIESYENMWLYDIPKKRILLDFTNWSENFIIGNKANQISEYR